MDLRNLIDELRRRRVTRVAAVYVVAAFGVLQAADLIVPRLLLPDWTVTLVLVLALLGFPVAVDSAPRPRSHIRSIPTARAQPRWTRAARWPSGSCGTVTMPARSLS